METQETVPHPSDGSILYDSDRSKFTDPSHQKSLFTQDGPILFDNHLNKNDWKEFSETYVPNQAIVYFDNKVAGHIPLDEKIEAVKKAFSKKGVPYDEITIGQCGSCGINVPLFLIKGPGVDTVIVSEGAPGGTQPPTKISGESYSLNFLSKIPKHTWESSKLDKGNVVTFDPKKGTVTIAVLDTGLDDTLVNPAYICNEFNPKEDMPCFSDVTKGGRNFVSDPVKYPDPSKYPDDNAGKHGSLVTQYIINQFTGESRNNVKIMPLKTHDANGNGDLFSILCAIQFAMAKGANIINASWGFYYYYEDNFLSYFQNLIGNELRQKGILFVTAAGNKDDYNDKLADLICLNQGRAPLTKAQLRDVGIHKFFPAHLSAEANNVITVTTTDVDIDSVSPQQNHSDTYVELGVKADKEKNDQRDDDPSFKEPFKLIPGTPAAYVAGSSFATPIAAGYIGANNDIAKYKPGLRKGDFLNPSLSPLTSALHRGSLLIERPAINNLIRNGICLQP